MMQMANAAPSGPITIMSVFPLERTHELKHEGYKTYRLPAAKKGTFSTLIVTDTYAWNRNYNVDDYELYQAPIPARVVVDNLLQIWTQGLTGTKDGLSPGILVCAGDAPTAAEIAEANAKQEAYFRNLVFEADAMFQREGGINITDLHRVAAEWMNQNDRAWIRPLTRDQQVECPACAEMIKPHAKVCKHCSTNIAAFLAAEQPDTAKVSVAKNTKPSA